MYATEQAAIRRRAPVVSSQSIEIKLDCQTAPPAPILVSAMGGKRMLADDPRRDFVRLHSDVAHRLLGGARLDAEQLTWTFPHAGN